MSNVISLEIGICDDNFEWRRSILAVCEIYLRNNNINHTICCFSSGEEVINYKSSNIDILFLDVEMSSMDGLEVMKHVEKMSNIKNIVFVSSHPEFVWDSFGYKTKGFISKPFEKDNITKYLNAIYLSKKQDTIIEFPDYNGITYFIKSSIVSIKSDSNYSTIYTEEKFQIVSCTLKECEKMLDGLPFLRVHRSYIVNLDYVSNMSSDTVYFKNGTTCTIGRSYRSIVKAEYRRYLRKELHQ